MKKLEKLIYSVNYLPQILYFVSAVLLFLVIFLVFNLILLIIRLLKTENYPNVEKATGCSVEGSFSIGIALGAGFILF